MTKCFLTKGICGLALATAMASTANAQEGGQIQSPAPAPTAGQRAIEQGIRDARAREVQNQEAALRQQAEVRAMLQRDLRIGNMTQAQQDSLVQFAQDRMAQATSRIPAAARDIQQAPGQFLENSITNMDNNRRALDPANADNVSNRDFSQSAASAGVEFVTDMNTMRLDIVRGLRPVVEDIGNASADIARERQRIIEGNNVSVEERARVRQETSRVTRAVDALPARLNEGEFRIRTETQRIRERETQIAQQIEQTVDQYGRDPANVPPGYTPVRRYPVAPRTVPTPATRPGPQPLPQPSTNPAARPPATPTPQRSTAGASGSGAQRGTIPGQGDATAGLTVPRSQGGTGPETSASRASAASQAQSRAQAQARVQAQAQAERNTARTEQLRQQAMARARGETLPQGPRAPINQPAPPPAERASRANELGTVDPTRGRASQSAEGSAARGQNANSAASAAGAAINQAAAAMAGADPSDRTARGSSGQAEFEREFRRRHFGLGRVGASQTGGSGEGSGASDDYSAIPSLVAWGSDMQPDISDAELLAMVERALTADENYRLLRSETSQNARDDAWRAMVDQRLAPNASIVDANYVQSQGRSISMTNLEQIYGPNSLNSGNAMQSLSAAGSAGPSSLGNSLSSAGNSLSTLGFDPRTFGIPLIRGSLDYTDPAVESLYDAMGMFDYRRRSRGLRSGMDGDPARAAQRAYNAGAFDVRFDWDGSEGRESGGYVAASLFSEEDLYLRQLTANGQSGLDRLLAQPFNVLLTWGANAFDLDLHMTGPTGEGSTSRFHIYYAATGSLTGQPFAQLIRDCICASGSEVVLTSALQRGGVYRVSVFNFGDQSATSTNLANASEATIQIVRGGVATSVGNGTTIVGGRTILRTTTPVGQPGNTWVAVELDPRNGRITVPRRIVQSSGSNNVGIASGGNIAAGGSGRDN